MTGRSVAEWIGKTPDEKAPDRVRARVFERHAGRCHVSGRKITAGEAWDLDHVIALCNGGENRESNLAPILRGKVHKEKTARDVAEKSRVASLQAKHLGLRNKGPSRLQGRGFPKRDKTKWRSEAELARMSGSAGGRG